MHRNARLTPEGRRILCERIAAGRPAAHVAAEMGVSRTTAYRWWNRYRREGVAGLVDRSSRPHRSPQRTSREVEARIIELRQTRKLGPVRIGLILSMPASTVWRVLCRYGLNRLAAMDRPSGRVIRRYERATPGDLLHVDIKKLGAIPPGGGSRFLGTAGVANNTATRVWDGTRQRSTVGYTYIHAAVDDYTRLSYVEALPNEKGTTAAGFIDRAITWFNQLGITINEVMTDNGPCYKSNIFTETLTLHSIRHRRTRPYRPQTNGKVERFNRTLLDEWAYIRHYNSEQQRTQALAEWIHTYNHHRHHTAIGGPPITRVTNLTKQHK